MLSYLYQMARSFELKHGHRPNLLYLTPAHFRMLQDELAAIPNLSGITRFLGMEIILSENCPHPVIAWSPVDWQKAVAI